MRWQSFLPYINQAEGIWKLQPGWFPKPIPIPVEFKLATFKHCLQFFNNWATLPKNNHYVSNWTNELTNYKYYVCQIIQEQK